MKSNLKGSLMLLLAAAIWGCAFVAQEEAADVGAFTLNGIRFVIGGTVLLPVILITRKLSAAKNTAERQPGIKPSILGGVVCGVMLAIAANLQQFGIMFNAEATDGDSGKAGFITAMYIILVPFFGLFFGKKITPSMIIGIITAVFGLYFISVKDGFSVAVGDICLLLCALAFSFHILFVDRLTAKADGIILSSAQFFTAGIISGILMLIFETPDINTILSAAVPILYIGVLSSGVAYTLQVVGQKYSEPTVASILMSLESLFALLAACVFYGKPPQPREAVGCGLMLFAILTVETPFVNRAFARLFKRNEKA